MRPTARSDSRVNTSFEFNMPTTTSLRRTKGTVGTTIIELDRCARMDLYTAAVSLHAHTNRSREVMTVVPPYLERIPLVAPLARSEIRAYQRRHGELIDFTKGWWQPPVRPEDVLASEVAQIRRVLRLTPFVSITDHDTIEACLVLQGAEQRPCVPLSFEWTVPYQRGFFHLGVHNLPPSSVFDIFDALSAFTRHPDPALLPGLLERLDGHPETLVVLNHPLWDLAGIGAVDHLSLLHRFLVDHAGTIHALELNGYRSWRENRGVVKLGTAFSLPMISGAIVTDAHRTACST